MRDLPLLISQGTAMQVPQRLACPPEAADSSTALAQPPPPKMYIRIQPL